MPEDFQTFIDLVLPHLVTTILTIFLISIILYDEGKGRERYINRNSRGVKKKKGWVGSSGKFCSGRSG